MVANRLTTVTQAAAPAPPYPKVRRIKFHFGEPQPMNHHFVEGDIVFSHLVAMLSAVFPPGEESFIRSVRRFADRVTDPTLKKRVAAFIGQESVHGQQHRALNEKLIAMGYSLVRLFTFPHDSRRQRMILRFENRTPGLVHLAMTAAAEHYTATLADRVLSRKEIQAIPGDPEVWNLLNWHATEELEHKSVAFDVYRTVGGPEWIRIGVMAVMYEVTIPITTALVMMSILTDRRGWRPIKVLRQTYGVFRGPLVKGLMADLRVYMRPGFHPDDVDTDQLVAQWRDDLFGAQGALVDHLK
ncbi:metal-dependent hydrolase [Mycolicibacter heraklionensis]|uniref:Metal-dependent hydrolase n=1 Tax=Mycolicibacter heraklionensis TaxID=512402 RepID=A0A9X7ZHG4_9MYCO|nr:metal-dependent hydrolase [Mycolicibacter heraklionensis]QZA08557.1 metal-dependent hydrolase [Mycolicibacter heraklionensis]